MHGSLETFLERLPLARGRPALAYGCSVAFALVATALRFLADPGLPPGYPYLTFFPSVILTSFLFGRGPGVLNAAICGLSAWLFFVPPAFSLAIAPSSAFSLLFYAAIVAIDISLVHWMQRANRRLRAERERSTALAETRELLFRELQHRISNNLQVVAALLTLQKRGVRDEAARAALDEAARRLALIGRIHRQLHDPNGQLLGLAPFLRQLCADVIESGGKPGIALQVEAEDELALEPDAAIPVALIVAEAVSNALEHGFAHADRGRIGVRLRRTGEMEAEVCVWDDGAGLPPGFDLERTDSLGLRIASTLARQLRGRFELLPEAGLTVARLLLPTGAAVR